MKPNIGVVVHGPGIIDTGCAKKIIDILSEYGNVTARLGGTMGRTAVIDANLEDVINIEDKLLPSESIELLSKTNDVVFLLNYGKSIVTGHTFGYKVLNNVKTPVDLIQIERPQKTDGCIIPWGHYDVDFIEEISKVLNLDIVNSDDVRRLVADKTGYESNNKTIERKVAGVSPGENIMLNGIIIGRVTEDELTIIAQDNQVIDMIGGDIKYHGLEKLDEIDLESAIIKTGLLRKADDITPRILEHESKPDKKVVFLDHAAEDLHEYKDSDLVVSIGDDTTLLSSDILYRFNIPIIGITDGDLDKVVLKGFKHDESIIIQVTSGFDDKVGSMIYEKIFNNDKILKTSNLDEFRKKLLDFVDSLDIEYEFVDKQL